MRQSDDGEEDIQSELRQHLYGATDLQADGDKNIIVDDDIDEDEESVIAGVGNASIEESM